MIFAVCFLVLPLTIAYELRFGLIAPIDDPVKNSAFGMGTSIGAVGLALDRIEREGLLPGANISFFYKHGPCMEFQNAPPVLEMLETNNVHVLFGPACPQGGILAGILSASFNRLMMIWSNSDPALDESARFPTMGIILPGATNLGLILKSVIDKFEWKNFALFTNDDTGSRKCFYGKSAFLDLLIGTDIRVTTSFEVAYKGEVPTVEFANFWRLAGGQTRIVIFCFDRPNDRRRFMQYSNAKGFVTDEYVYVTTQFLSDVNTSQPWVDYSDKPDGLDDQTRLIYEKVLMVEKQNEESVYVKFKADVIERAKSSPINYALKPTDTIGSLYSPYLHDSVYVAAIAINKTLRGGGNPANGTLNLQNMFNLVCIGAGENVSLDYTGSRVPIFTMKTFNKDHQYQLVAISTISPAGVPVANLLVPEEDIWALRGGKRPPDTPICDYDGSRCRDYTALIAALVGSFGGLAVVGAVAGGIYRYKRHKSAAANCQKIWRIEKFLFLDMKVAHAITSMASGMSSRTGSTNFAGSHATLGSVSSDVKLKNAVLPPNCSIMSYKTDLTWCKKWEIRGLVIQHKPDHIEFNRMRGFNHDNLNVFLGVCIDTPGEFISAWRFCPKFSLQEIFNHEHIKLDWFFKYSIMKDVLDGLHYIHDSPLKSHGHLKSKNVLMDGRWMIKLTDYGLTKFRQFGPVETYEDLLWTAPELLRLQHDKPPLGSPKGDIFSFAILMQEIITESKPYESALNPDEPPNYEKILHNVRAGVDPPIRPTIDLSASGDVDQRILAIAEGCWSENPDSRPDVKTLKASLKRLQVGKHRSMMDHVMNVMEKYAENLENTVRDRTVQLTEEKKRCDQLLYSMLPQAVAEKLKTGQQFEPESYDSATVFFSDVVGFEEMKGKSTALQVVNMLNQLYTLFDNTIAKFDVYKVETIGEEYLCVSGIPNKNGVKHVSEIAKLSLSLMEQIGSLKIAHLGNEELQLRIGLCTGPTCAGVVGIALPHYCLFGDTVNTASRMKSHGTPGKIQVTDSTRILLNKLGFNTEKRGEIAVKVNILSLKET